MNSSISDLLWAKFRLLTVAWFFWGAASLHGALVSEDHLVFGTGAITFDTVSGLRWLDLTHTLHASYNQTEAQLGTGGTFDGFRFASRTEFEQLLNSQGIPAISGNDSFFQFGSGAASPAGTQNIINLLGSTIFQAPGGFIGMYLSDNPSSAVAYRLSYSSAAQVTTVQTITQSRAAQSTNPFGYSSLLVASQPGDSPSNPVLPDNFNDPLVDPPVWRFEDVPGNGRWFDPPLAGAYVYETDGLSNFTQVILPTTVGDADGMFNIGDATNGMVTVAAGSPYVFPVPVSKFTVTGIDPLVDGGDPLAFPTFLAFDQQVVSFTQTAIPEPATLVSIVTAVVAAAYRPRPGRVRPI
jgi:hypothetical protein